MDPTQLQQIVQESMAAVIPMELDGDRPSQSIGTSALPLPELVRAPDSGPALGPALGSAPGPALGPGPAPDARFPEAQNVAAVQDAPAKSQGSPPAVQESNPAAEREAQADDVGVPMEDLIHDQEHPDNN